MGGGTRATDLNRADDSSSSEAFCTILFPIQSTNVKKTNAREDMLHGDGGRQVSTSSPGLRSTRCSKFDDPGCHVVPSHLQACFGTVSLASAAHVGPFKHLRGAMIAGFLDGTWIGGDVGACRCRLADLLNAV